MSSESKLRPKPKAVVHNTELWTSVEPQGSQSRFRVCLQAPDSMENHGGFELKHNSFSLDASPTVDTEEDDRNAIEIKPMPERRKKGKHTRNHHHDFTSSKIAMRNNCGEKSSTRVGQFLTLTQSQDDSQITASTYEDSYSASRSNKGHSSRFCGGPTSIQEEYVESYDVSESSSVEFTSKRETSSLWCQADAMFSREFNEEGSGKFDEVGADLREVDSDFSLNSIETASTTEDTNLSASQHEDDESAPCSINSCRKKTRNESFLRHNEDALQSMPMQRSPSHRRSFRRKLENIQHESLKTISSGEASRHSYISNHSSPLNSGDSAFFEHSVGESLSIGSRDESHVTESSSRIQIHPVHSSQISSGVGVESPSIWTHLKDFIGGKGRDRKGNNNDLSSSDQSLSPRGVFLVGSSIDEADEQISVHSNGKSGDSCGSQGDLVYRGWDGKRNHFTLSPKRPMGANRKKVFSPGDVVHLVKHRRPPSDLSSINNGHSLKYGQERELLRSLFDSEELNNPSIIREIEEREERLLRGSIASTEDQSCQQSGKSDRLGPSVNQSISAARTSSTRSEFSNSPSIKSHHRRTHGWDAIFSHHRIDEMCVEVDSLSLTDDGSARASVENPPKIRRYSQSSILKNISEVECSHSDEEEVSSFGVDRSIDSALQNNRKKSKNQLLHHIDKVKINPLATEQAIEVEDIRHQEETPSLKSDDETDISGKNEKPSPVRAVKARLKSWISRDSVTSPNSPTPTTELHPEVSTVAEEEDADVMEIFPGHLPTCSFLATDSHRTGVPIKSIASGWLAYSTGEKLFQNLKASPDSYINRKNVGYMMILEDPSIVQLLGSTGGSSARAGRRGIFSIPISQDSLVECKWISKLHGNCIIISEGKRSHPICTLLPINLPEQCFKSSKRKQLVKDDEFIAAQKSIREPYSTRAARKTSKKNASEWGDPCFLDSFASNEQHDATMHILFVLHALIGRAH